MSVYVVTAYRWGQRNAHSYVVGAFTNKTAAIECAEAHVDYRGGKYGCEVVNALEWTEDADNVAEQVYYSESPYFGKAGDAGHFHAADIKKRCVPSQKPFTVRELQNKVGELQRENAALREALATAEDGLRHGLMMQPADPFQRGRVISAALDAVRAALGKEAKP